MTLDLFVEVAGWIAAVLILGAYALLTAGRLGPKSIAYQAMNVVGAIGFIINSSWNGAIPSAALNVVWAGIGLVAIAGVLRARRRATPEA
ncbi:hypothetical protein GCM10022280_26190 [Sphingomonas swuensis]|uniref:CBU-0592-like domain-containing protein n=1 Tax=Sphingomonas swuensis TaxID=977800 RepID=A0ABP7TE19_9SPHN